MPAPTPPNSHPPSSRLPRLPHLHFVGIAGAFMAGVAKLAHELGHPISGSDAAFYPPAGAAIRALSAASGAPIFTGYDADCAERPADLYIIGNVISRGNPLLESILRDKRPYTSAPQWLADNILARRRVIAVAGTHGKTTTTSLLAYLLRRAGAAPGFLLGGVDQNFGDCACLSPESEWFVIEADEYDSAFFDKRPKFIHYRPDILVINNLEFDHADIYPDVAAIIRQFGLLLRGVPDNGAVITRAGCPNIAAAIAAGCWTPVNYLGAQWQWRRDDDGDDGNDGDSRDGGDGGSSLPSAQRQRGDESDGSGGGSGDDGGLSAIRIERDGVVVATLRSPLAGDMNRDNLLAATVAAIASGVSPARLSVDGYIAPRRRLQKLCDGDIRLYDDFAHHPTAFAATLAALAEVRPRPKRIIAVFERRSNTMKTDIFADRLAPALALADIIVAVDDDTTRAQKTFARRQSPFYAESSAASAARRIIEIASPGDAIILMSNSGNTTLIDALTKHLSRRQ